MQYLAPNGQPSNLTPEQCKLVRTPEFKQWFGDWETQYKSTLIQLNNGRLIYDGKDIGIFEITRKENVVEIDRLYIDDEYKNQGIGKACIQYLFNMEGITLVELYPHPATQSFWLRNGVFNVRKSDGYFEIDNKKYQCSKVVDENGEPMVVYHGSANDFTEFKDSFIGANYNYSKRGGFFFTQKEKTAKNYAYLHSELKNEGFVYSCFINVRNPIYRKVNSDYILPIDFYDTHSSEFVHEKNLNRKLDGVLIKGTNKDNLVVAFKSNQIKLADGTNTTFDKNNPDIRFEEGGEISLKINSYKQMDYKSLLKEIHDSYVDLGAEKGLKGHDANGEPIFGYLPYQSEFMLTSNKTGHKIRYYIEIDKDYFVHPSEINPSFTVSEQKRLENLADYWLRESKDSYEKIVTELGKNNELEIVKETLQKAIKNGFIIESQYDSSDYFKQFPHDILIREDLISGNRMARTLSQYIKNQEIDLKTNISDLDLKRFSQENPIIFAEGGEAEAEKVWNSLSDEDKKNLMEAGMKAMDSMKEEYSQKLIDLESQKSALVQKRNDIFEQEKTQENKYDLTLFKERQKIGEQIRDINLQIRHAKNVEKAFFNRGDIVQFEDKKGTLHANIPSFTKVDTSVIAFDEETILAEEPPKYIPFINEEVFKSKGFVFDTIRIDKDTYILAVNGYKEREKIDKDISHEVANNFYTPQVYEQGFVLVTLDQLVLINDYYITKQKAIYQKEADEKTKRQEGYYNQLPVSRREAHLNQKNFYHALPSAVKKKITQTEYEALDLEGKEAIYKPFKRYSHERLKTRLHSNEMWASFHQMYERFIDPTAVMPKPRSANPIVWNYWVKFREMMSYKMKDIKIQREVDNEQYNKALETSFGDINTNDTLFNKYGVLVKRQDGKQIEPHQIEQIEQGWIKIQKVFGDLVNISKENNIKISHTNDKHVFASKSVGMFVPKMKTIAVSNKYGANTFDDVFAHETAHFIDYLVGTKNGQRYATDDYESTAGILAFRFRELLNQKSDSEYLSSTKECFARALEQHFAIQTFGDEAQLLFSNSPLQQLTFYFDEANYVNKENYYNEIKPLVEKFLVETGFSAYIEPESTSEEIVEIKLTEKEPVQEIEIKQEKMENAKLISALKQIDESIKVYNENKNKKTKQLIGESLEKAINLLKLESEYSDNALTDDEKLLVVKKVIEVCKNTLKDSYTSNWMLFDSEINFPFNIWNVLKEMDYIKAENIKKVPFVINPNNDGLKTIFKDIVGQDYLRPVMQSIEINNNQATGTDAHKLLHLIGKREGDFIDGIYPVRPLKEGDKVDPKQTFMQWQRIFPDEATHRVKINLKFLYNVIDNLYDNKVLGDGLPMVGFRIKEDEEYNFDVVVNYPIISDLMKSLMKAGFEEMDMCLTTRNRAIMFVPADAKLDGNPSDRANLINNHSFGLVMPVIVNDYMKYPIIDINNKDEYQLITTNAPSVTISATDFNQTKPKVEKSAKKEESNESSSEIEFLKSKIEAFKDLIDIEEDENEIAFLKEKLLAFQDMLELEELSPSDETKKKSPIVDVKIKGDYMKHGNSLIKDYILFFFQTADLKKDITIELNFKKLDSNQIGYVDLISIAKGKFQLFIDKNASFESVLNYLAHELTHVQQYIDGRLTNDDENLIWQGENFITVKEYDEMVKNISSNLLAYLELPWEQEATENQKIFLQKYISSENFVNFKSNISEPNLKFIVEMLSNDSVKENLVEAPEIQDNLQEADEVVVVDQETPSFEVGKAKPSHLMTLEEYQKIVSPLIKEYRAFLRKNEKWFVATDFNGLVYYSLEEALENAKNDTTAGWFFKMPKDNWRNMTPEQNARYSFAYRKGIKDGLNYTQEPTPKALIEKKNEYIDELSKYFTNEELQSRIEKDELNSNKRSIRRAIDNKTYTQLLIDGEITFEQLREIGASAGVNIPASVMPKKDFADFTHKKELQKIIGDLPRQSQEQLNQLSEQIQTDLQPLEQEIIERETTRLTTLLKDVENSEVELSRLGTIVPFWAKVLNAEPSFKKVGDNKIIVLKELKPDWEKQLRLVIFEYVSSLKWKLVLSIMKHFQYITKPMKEIIRIDVGVINQKFEGTYQFVFEDGSYFNMHTESIGAGGHNIQAFHFRYITTFSDITLKNGEKIRYSNYNLINNFSVKK